MKIKPPSKVEQTPTQPRGEWQGQLNLFVRELAGEDGLKIITCIGENGITDDKIEQTTKMKIAEIRSVLNHLHSYGLVEYTREKNLQTGWFTYTWRLNTNRALQNFLSVKKREYTQLRQRLGQGDCGQIYQCQKNCNCLEFEKAIEHGFRCPGCKGKLNAVDQEEELKKLEKKINALSTIAELSIPEHFAPKLPSLHQRA